MIEAGFHERRTERGNELRERMPAAVEIELAEDVTFRDGRVAHVGRSAIAFGRSCRRCRNALDAIRSRVGAERADQSDRAER